MLRRSTLLLAPLSCALAFAVPAAATEVTFLVKTSPAQEILSRLEMIDTSSIQPIPVTGSIVADVSLLPDGFAGAYVSSFRALGGQLTLANGQLTSYALTPPTSTCLGTGNFCDPASAYCTETIVGTPGQSLVTADLLSFALTPGGAALEAAPVGPGTSTFPLFDAQNPDPDDNFKLTATSGNFAAEGCALNEIVGELHNFGCGGCESDFWGFTGQATTSVVGADITLTLPMNHNLLVIGWSGSDQNYGILNLSGDVVLVPEPSAAVSLGCGAGLLGLLSLRRERRRNRRRRAGDMR